MTSTIMSTAFHLTRSNEFDRPASNAWIAEQISQARDSLVAMFVKPAPRPMTRQQEANELRWVAADLVSTDPDFADDLFAAADRHEHQRIAII